MQLARTFSEGQERLAQTPQGREILEMYVDIADVETYLRSISRISETAREQMLQRLRKAAKGADVVPYYLLGFLLSDPETEERETPLVELTLKYRPGLEVHTTRGLTLH